MIIRNMLITLLLLLLVMLLLLGGLRFFGLAEGVRPDSLGLINNQLADCPDKPNCVSSYSASEIHTIEPLPYELNAVVSIKKITTVLQASNRITIITTTSNYIHAESKSLLLGFVDDVEVYCDDEKQRCFVRSASRLGRTDFGVNRKRIEQIRTLLVQVN